MAIQKLKHINLAMNAHIETILLLYVRIDNFPINTILFSNLNKYLLLLS